MPVRRYPTARRSPTLRVLTPFVRLVLRPFRRRLVRMSPDLQLHPCSSAIFLFDLSIAFRRFVGRIKLRTAEQADISERLSLYELDVSPLHKFQNRQEETDHGSLAAQFFEETS